MRPLATVMFIFSYGELNCIVFNSIYFRYIFCWLDFKRASNVHIYEAISIVSKKRIIL